MTYQIDLGECYLDGTNKLVSWWANKFYLFSSNAQNNKVYAISWFK